MAFEFERLLDETGWLLLEELQNNARLSYSELGQRVGLSSPAVADRIRKLEEAGIIKGYHAEIDLAKLGLPVTAIIRIGTVAGQSCTRVLASVTKIPGVIECYRVTGSDSVIVKAAATSVEHLETIIDQLTNYGPSMTSIVLSRSIDRRTITRDMTERRALLDEIASTEV